MSDQAVTLEQLAEEQIVAGTMDGEHLRAMQALILQDGTIDDQEVAVLRNMIKKTQKRSSPEVKRAEIEFLFALNEATVGGRNDANWKTFFIESVAAHVLDDEDSSGVVDEKEAAWLIDMIERDSQYDPNEIALLEYIQEHAKEIPITIKFRLGMILTLV